MPFSAGPLPLGDITSRFGDCVPRPVALSFDPSAFCFYERTKKNVTDKTCSTCQSRQFRRINRNGFMQHRVLTRLGYFPWECILCRRRMFFRDEGRRTLPLAPNRPPAEVSRVGKYPAP